ncbi:hypothetical protein ABZ619_21440 [Streptomyces sp. NPDC007851]|uniref:hypothetical protein n=1 Tax=Streptomyces sp. NPDC007851 TaxID=3155008 RepID=UPI0033E27D70
MTSAAHQLTSRTEVDFRPRCRDEVFRHAQRLPPHYCENNPPADLPARFTAAVDEAGHVGPGGRRRVAVARGLVRDTPVLGPDEPTTGPDGESARRVRKPLRRPMASRTTFLITHDTQLAARSDAVLPVGPLPGPLDMPPMGGRAKVV